MPDQRLLLLLDQFLGLTCVLMLEGTVNLPVQFEKPRIDFKLFLDRFARKLDVRLVEFVFYLLLVFVYDLTEGVVLLQYEISHLIHDLTRPLRRKMRSRRRGRRP